MPVLYQLSADDPVAHFPPTSHALEQPNGLLAMGGDLSPARLVAAYQKGIFPWFSEDEPILWWSPNPRTVFIPGETHTSKRLARRLRRQDFGITMDRAFESVVKECAQPRKDSGGTWLIPEMRSAYQELHRQGYAHSIEVWQNGSLVAGLYGVALGKAFFGESMFSHVTDMSKIALTLLSRQLQLWGYLIFDAQVASRHLYTMGAIEITRDTFEAYLHKAIPPRPQPCVWEYSASLPSSVRHLP